MLASAPSSTRFQKSRRIPLYLLLTDNPVLRREMRERWRRPMTFLLLGLYSSLLTWMAYFFFSYLAVKGSIDFSASNQDNQNFFLAFSLIQILLSMSAAALLAAPTLAIERVRGSWRDMMLAGLSAHQVTFAKFFAMLSLVVVLAIIPIPTISLCYLFGGVSPLSIVVVNALNLSSAATTIAVALCLSAAAANVGQAVARTLGMLVCLLPALPLLAGTILPNIILSLIVFFFECGLTFILLAYASEILRDTSRFEKANPGPIAPVATFAERRAQLRKTSKLATSVISSPASSRLRKDLKTNLPTDLNGAPNSDSLQARMDNFWEELSLRHPIAMREYRVRWRWSDEVNKTQRFLHYAFLCGFGLLAFGNALGVYEGEVELDSAWRMLAIFLTLSVMGSAALVGAESFSLEREAKMMVSLQLTALSPLDIVFGKIFSTTLWVTRRFWWFVLAVYSAGLVTALLNSHPLQSLLAYIMAFFAFGGCFLLAASVGVALSSICDSTTTASAGTMALLGGAFIFAPLMEGPRGYANQPFWSAWWKVPLQIWLDTGFLPRAFLVANTLITLNCLVLCSILIGLAASYLARLRSDDTESLLQRDLNRSWN